MKQLFLFILILYALLFGSPIICNSQITDSLNIKKDSICIGVDSFKMLYSLFYEIENKSSSTFYLWIEKDIHLSEREKIRDYWMKNKGDMSLYQMAMERNITYDCLSIFETFLKKIEPQEKFTVQIISTVELSECEKEQVFRYLDEHTVIIREDVLEQHIKGLSDFNPLLFYKQDFITIPFAPDGSSV